MSLSVIMGCMFAGKSSELLRRIRREKAAKRKCIVIRFAGDNRYSETKIVSHNKDSCDAISCIRLADLGRDSALLTLQDADTICIDEGQFFPDLVKFCEKWANAGKRVIVAGLDGDFNRRPFGQMCRLIPLAEEVIKLTAICSICQADAAFTKRTRAGNEKIMIGGSESYIAVCRSCHAK